MCWTFWIWGLHRVPLCGVVFIFCLENRQRLATGEGSSARIRWWYICFCSSFSSSCTRWFFMRERSIPSCSSLYTQGMSPGKCSRTKSQIQHFSVTSTLCAMGYICWKSQSVPDLVQKQQPYTAPKDPGENLGKAHWYLSPWALCSHHKTSDLSHAGLTDPVQDAGDMQRCCCSVTKSCSTLHDPMDCSMPGSPVLHHYQSLLKFMAIEPVMPSHPLSSPSPFAFSLSQHLSLFKWVQWVGCYHQGAKVLKLQL